MVCELYERVKLASFNMLIAHKSLVLTVVYSSQLWFR